MLVIEIIKEAEGLQIFTKGSAPVLTIRHDTQEEAAPAQFIQSRERIGEEPARLIGANTQCFKDLGTQVGIRPGESDLVQRLHRCNGEIRLVLRHLAAQLTYVCFYGFSQLLASERGGERVVLWIKTHVEEGARASLPPDLKHGRVAFRSASTTSRHSQTGDNGWFFLPGQAHVQTKGFLPCVTFFMRYLEIIPAQRRSLCAGMTKTTPRMVPGYHRQGRTQPPAVASGSSYGQNRAGCAPPSARYVWRGSRKCCGAGARSHAR